MKGKLTTPVRNRLSRNSRSHGAIRPETVLKECSSPIIFKDHLHVWIAIFQTGVHEAFAFGWKTCHWNCARKCEYGYSWYEHDAAWSHDCGIKESQLPGKRSAKRSVLPNFVKRDSLLKSPSIGSIHPRRYKEILFEDQGILWTFAGVDKVTSTPTETNFDSLWNEDARVPGHGCGKRRVFD